MAADIAPPPEVRPKWPQGPNNVRLRRTLGGALQAPRWPEGFSLRTFEAGDAPDVYALLSRVFDDGADGPFEEWWARISGDPEFDPKLFFLVDDEHGRLAAVAWAWSSAFVRDVAVDPGVRRLGLAEALMRHVFAVFQARGAAHVDLKTDLVVDADAARLYRRLDMVEVDWEG
jgi:ribosomal protein S18 acetylase RimI-like enzyme